MIRLSDAPREYRALLCAGGVGPPSTRAEAFGRLNDEGLDWTRLWELGRHHKVVPVLVDLLQRQPGDRLPAYSRGRIERHRRHAFPRTLWLTGQLARIFDRFEHEGIEALSFKGATLAALAYGDLRLREFCDLDILVRRRDVPAAAAALATLGFQPRLALGADIAHALLDAENALAFHDEADRCLVELHWALTPKYVAFGDEDETVWSGLVATAPGGRAIPTLAPERLLRFLCVHAAKHFCERLVWSSDIAHLVSCGVEIDWTRLVADADRTGSRRMLWLGLALARDLLDAPVPDDVSRQIDADRTVRWLVIEASRALAGAPAGRVRRLQFHLAMRDRLRDRLHYGVHAALTPSVRDFESVRLPKSLSRLYGPLRPFRLLRDYTGHGRPS